LRKARRLIVIFRIAPEGYQYLNTIYDFHVIDAG